MNKYILLAKGLGLCLLLSSLSCSHQNTDLGLLTPKSEKSSNKEAHLRISIKHPNTVSLRAVSSPEDPMQEIKSLRFVFYSGQDGQEAVAYTREIGVDSQTDLSQIDLTLPPNDYKLVTIANPTGLLVSDTQVGSPLTRLTTYQKHSTDDFVNFTGSEGEQIESIVLLNDQGPITVSQGLFVSSSTTPNSPVTVHLESSLARILVYGSPIIKSGRANQISATYQVSNLSSALPWLRPLARLSSGTDEVQGDNSSLAQRYSKGGLSDITTAPTTTNGIGQLNFATLPESHWRPISADVQRALGKQKLLSTYCKEAVVSPLAYTLGTTPCIVIRHSYIPNGLELSENEGWLSYQGRFYREQDIKQWIGNGQWPNEQLKTAVQGANLTTQSFNAGFEKNGLKFYHRSLNYYTVYIRHFDDTLAPNRDSYGRYGVIRNNEYRINIESITGPGASVAPNYKDNCSPIVEVQNIRTSISVNIASERNQSVHL